MDHAVDLTVDQAATMAVQQMGAPTGVAVDLTVARAAAVVIQPVVPAVIAVDLTVDQAPAVTIHPVVVPTIALTQQQPVHDQYECECEGCCWLLEQELQQMREQLSVAQQQAVAVVAAPPTTGELVPSVPISSMAATMDPSEDQVAYTVAPAEAVDPAVHISSVAATVDPSEDQVAYTVAPIEAVDPAVNISPVAATVDPSKDQVACTSPLYQVEAPAPTMDHLVDGASSVMSISGNRKWKQIKKNWRLWRKPQKSSILGSKANNLEGA